MKEEVKQQIVIILDLLAKTLEDTGTVVGIVVDKKDPEKSKIAFVDFESYCNGHRDGFSIKPEVLNRGLLEKKGGL